MECRYPVIAAVETGPRSRIEMGFLCHRAFLMPLRKLLAACTLEPFCRVEHCGIYVVRDRHGIAESRYLSISTYT
jgi:hypothetical protein